MMEKKPQQPIIKKLKDLGDNWLNFIYLLINPFVLFLLIASIFLLIYSSKLTDPYMISIFTIIISIVTGLLGGIYAKRWDD